MWPRYTSTIFLYLELVDCQFFDQMNANCLLLDFLSWTILFIFNDVVIISIVIILRVVVKDVNYYNYPFAETDDEMIVTLDDIECAYGTTDGTDENRNLRTLLNLVKQATTD